MLAAKHRNHGLHNFESESGVKGMTIPEGKHCHYTTARNTIKAGGCHLHGTLTDEVTRKPKHCCGQVVHVQNNV